MLILCDGHLPTQCLLSRYNGTVHHHDILSGSKAAGGSGVVLPSNLSDNLSFKMTSLVTQSCSQSVDLHLPASATLIACQLSKLQVIIASCHIMS